MVQFIWPNMSTRILPWTNRIHDIVLHQYIVPSQSLHYIHYKRSSLAGSLLIRNRSFMLLTTFGRGAAASFSLFTTISPIWGSQKLKPTSPSQLFIFFLPQALHQVALRDSKNHNMNNLYREVVLALFIILMYFLLRVLIGNRANFRYTKTV